MINEIDGNGANNIKENENLSVNKIPEVNHKESNQGRKYMKFVLYIKIMNVWTKLYGQNPNNIPLCLFVMFFFLLDCFIFCALKVKYLLYC